MSEKKLYYTVEEAAVKLGVAKETIRRYIRNGRLVAVMNCRKKGFQIPVDLVDNFDSNMFDTAVAKAYIDRQRKALTALRAHYEMEIDLIDELLAKLS